MRSLSLISIPVIALIAILMLGFNSSDSPHGKNFNMKCKDCHTTDGWKMDADSKFDHNTTAFKLEGLHSGADCKQCHPTLVFVEASLQCSGCHTDVHEQTLGQDCDRCHFPNAWLVSNITELHQNSRFPLVGAHLLADCSDCHKTESLLKFESLGVNCIDCHKETFIATTEPNHTEAGFSMQCEECHRLNAYEWASTGYNHDFFPLTQGHNIPDCRECHELGNYTNTSPECVDCHEQDFNTADNPDHVNSQFSSICTDCHNTNPGWKPATFDHNEFPLTLGHNVEDCTECHKQGNYTNTSSECSDCHINDFNSSVNPNHVDLQFSKTCTECHSTNPGWKPTTYNHDLFPLTLGHKISTCTDCHIGGNYTTTTSDCIGCHTKDYNNTKNPDHVISNFAKTCNDCHTTNPGWKPATFDHASFFPIYSGEHRGEWNSCTDCHNAGGNYSLYSCIDCHEHNKSEMDKEHQGEAGYVYNSIECFNCHPKGEKE